MRINAETSVGFFIISAIIVFLYMSFKIGVWRLDTVRYVHYIAYFSDVSGLEEKATVMVAGVKVGWVQKLSLVSRYRQVKVEMMIDKNSILHTNAHGVIKQNGLLGQKYIEIYPGDPSLPILTHGSTLMKPSKSTASIDDLLSTFKEIADNINEVSLSFKKAVGNNENGLSKLDELITSAKNAFVEIKDASSSLHSLFDRNTEKVDNTLSNIQALTLDLRERFPNNLDSIGRAADSIKIDINEVSQSIKKTIDPIKNAVEKIHDGKGVIGALINDEVMLKEVKSAVHGVKHYFQYVDRLGVDFDMHVESMHSRGNDLDFKDAKGFMNVLIKPSEDFYYLAGITSSYAGRLKRFRVDQKWNDEKKQEIIPSSILVGDDPVTQFAKLKFAPVKEKYVRHYDDITFNLQFCRNVGNLSLRTGLFESSFGLGVDYDVPLVGENKWTTTFEAYRFYEFLSHTKDGRMKFDSDRPHFKWLNKVFFNDSLYFVFGADDFISRLNKNFFVGMGLSFENDDVKYLAPKIGF